MFNTSSCGYSLSDIAAVTGSTNGRNGSGSSWGDDSWWIILLFLFIGWGRGGYGGFGGGDNGGSGSTVKEEIAYGFDMNGLESGVRGIQTGLCDGFYSMNTGMLNGFSGIQSTLCQGFAGVNSAITADTIANMQNTNAIGAQITALATQTADCCCQTQRAIERGFADTNYALATQSCDTRRAVSDAARDIIDSQTSGTRAILDFLTQDKIASLTAENQSLKFAASQSAQNAFITANQSAQTAEIIRRLETPCPIPAYMVPNPNCCYGTGYAGFGLYSNCGCA